MQIAKLPIDYTPKGRDVHVLPNSGYWSTKVEAHPFNNGTYLTQVEAMAEGIRQAREGLAVLLVHARDGRVRALYNYATFTSPDA